MERIVAIVEDRDDVAALEFAIGGITGVRVLRLSDGRGLMRALSSSTLELAALVTDLDLPFYNGFEILTAVRAHERYTQKPIVMITGDGRADACEMAKKLGANAFFTKPYSPIAIRRALEALMNVE